MGQHLSVGDITYCRLCQYRPGKLHTGSLLLGCVLMFIGGSPGGTAGGIKTVTITLLAFAVIATIMGREDVELGHRRVSMDTVMKGTCVILLQVFFLVISILPFAAWNRIFHLFKSCMRLFPHWAPWDLRWESRRDCPWPGN